MLELWRSKIFFDSLLNLYRYFSCYFNSSSTETPSALAIFATVCTFGLTATSLRVAGEPVTSFPNWRRGWDSNPRYPCGYTVFPGLRLKPLGHLSKIKWRWEEDSNLRSDKSDSRSQGARNRPLCHPTWETGTRSKRSLSISLTLGGTPERIRTSDLQLRKLAFYPLNYGRTLFLILASFLLFQKTSAKIMG